MLHIQTLVVGAIGTNCYILYEDESRDAALIDPGDEAERIEERLAELSLTPRYFLLTHGHFDHMLALPALRNKFRSAVTVIHREDADRLIKPALAHVPPSRRGDFTLVADETAGEGDVLCLGSLSLRWLHTPGHTPGSCCIAAGDALFTGDTLFAGDCGRTDLRGGDDGAMLCSLRRLGMLEGDRTVYPGHGGSSTLSRERRDNQWLRKAMRAGEP